MTAFRFLTAGESHGPALGVTIEGVPAGLALTEDAIAADLVRRQKGYGRGARQQIEQDRAEILGGVRHGVTLGSPVMLLVRNRDWENWTKVMQVAPLSEDEARDLAELADGGDKRATPVTRVRPGHADLAGALKYGFNDVRNVLERAPAPARRRRGSPRAPSRARSCARSGSRSGPSRPRSAGVAVDPANCTRSREEADASPLRCPDPAAEAAMIARIDEARSNGDTVGGVFEVVAHGLPIGLGLVRPLGSTPRRRPGRGRDEHQHREGRRVRSRLRADAPVRLGRPRRHRRARERRPLGASVQQRRGPDRRRHQRRAARGPRSGEADLDARATACRRRT